MINHSCHPNAVQSFNGSVNRIQVHCCRFVSNAHDKHADGHILLAKHCSWSAFQLGASLIHYCRAVRSIEPGEEVTISYTDLKTTRPERRAFLLQLYYHFDTDAAAVGRQVNQSAEGCGGARGGSQRRSCASL